MNSWSALSNPSATVSHLMAVASGDSSAAPIALGHPVEVMDQSFGVRAVCVRELVEFDALSDEHREYMGSWQHGT